MNKNVEEYADQCAVMKMANASVKKSLAATAHLQKVEENNEGDTSLPLDVFGSFSRIQIALIESPKNEANPTCLTCNLSVAEVEYIYKRTEIALYMEMQKKSDIALGSEGTSPAYTVRFAMGKLKGKTPAEIGDKEQLESQKAYLLENIAKYPANQKVVDAIDDALRLMEAGELQKGNESVVSLPTFSIFDSSSKTRYSVTDDKGNVLITDIHITCDLNKDFPVEVMVHNCFAPVNKDSTGRQIIEMKNAVNHKKATYNLTLFDFYTFIDKCKKTCERYGDQYFDNAAVLADKYKWKPDPAKGKGPQGTQKPKPQPNDQKDASEVPPSQSSQQTQPTSQQENTTTQQTQSPKEIPESQPETKAFTFFTKAEVIEEGDNFTVAVVVDGFKQIGKLVIEKQIASKQSWWPEFVKKSATEDGVKNFKAMAERTGDTFTYLSLAK